MSRSTYSPANSPWSEFRFCGQAQADRLHVFFFSHDWMRPMSQSQRCRYGRLHRRRSNCRSRLRPWQRPRPHKKSDQRSSIALAHRRKSKELMRSPMTTTCNQGVALSLSLALLSLPFLASCARESTRLAPSSPVPTAAPPTPPPKSSRTIHFQGLDHDYRGSTGILPDDRRVHRKEPLQ